MFPIKAKINSGTLDIKEYDFQKNIFVGSNDKKYTIEEIEYFIVPTKEMKKISGVSNKNTSDKSTAEAQPMIKTERRNRNYSK